MLTGKAARFPLLALLLLAVLAWRALDSARWLAARGRGWDVVAEGLRGERDDELYRRALGADFEPFAALRDHVPAGAPVVLVGASSAAAGFYQRMEALLFPSRLTALPPEAFASWRAPTPERDLYLLAYDGADHVEFERWFEPVETGTSARLYRLPGRHTADAAGEEPR